MDPPKPPSLVNATARFTDAQLDSVIRFGHGVMPALGSSLDESDRRAIVAYLHTLRGAP
jgi:mono/diheme cytochrome c family protein